jgi:hypothetical protein
MPSVTSATISSVEYDESSLKLMVRMKSGQAIQYEEVPRGVFAMLLTTPGPDNFYTGQVRDRYPISQT